MSRLWVPFRRAVALALIPAIVGACYTWEAARPTPAEYLQNRHAEEARLTRTDGARITVRNAELRGDSVTGITGGSLARGDTLRLVAIALADVQRMEVRTYSAGLTVGLIAVITLTLAIIASQIDIIPTIQ